MINLFDKIFYYTIKILMLTYMHLLYKLEVKGSCYVPKAGGVLLVGNHSSWIDTPILVNGINRRFWFVSGDFIMQYPIMQALLKHLFVIHLSKKDSKKGIAQTIEKLKEDEAVCIFPEGELTYTGETQRFRNGVSIIQKATNVPIVPFYIDGAFDIWSRKQTKQLFFKKIKLTFGEPFVPHAQTDKEIAVEIREKVLTLK